MLKSLKKLLQHIYFNQKTSEWTAFVLFCWSWNCLYSWEFLNVLLVLEVPYPIEGAGNLSQLPLLCVSVLTNKRELHFNAGSELNSQFTLSFVTHNYIDSNFRGSNLIFWAFFTLINRSFFGLWSKYRESYYKIECNAVCWCPTLR